MKKWAMNKWVIFSFLLSSLLLLNVAAYAQENLGADKSVPANDEVKVLASLEKTQQPLAGTPETQEAIIDDTAGTRNVSLDFKEADIRNVLKIISYKSGINIVTTPDVAGNVTIRLVDVAWDKALDVILKTYGFGYERRANIITVAPIDKLTSLKKQEVELAEVQPTVAEVFHLKFIDAEDARKAITPQLSARGKATALEMAAQAGWEFSQIKTQSSQEDSSKLKRDTTNKILRSRILIVSDVPPAIEKIKEIIAQIDIMPKQVLIETRIMEVNRDKLRDIGVDWGTGTSGATSTTITAVPTKTSASGATRTQAGGNSLSSQIKPGLFNPLSTDIAGKYPYNTGLNFLFQKLNGNQFEVMIHALEEDDNTNTLSAPRIVALNNQEATILVGTKYPILLQNVTGAGSTAITTVTLDHYQDIGIQLNVVPQIGSNGYINMVVHPAVTSYSTTLGDNKYPIIEAREAETRVLMKDGETIVIGGLLKDYKGKDTLGIPFLSQLPVVGGMFRRDTNINKKIDLVVFISTHIVKDDDYNPQLLAQWEEKMKLVDPKAKDKNKKKGKEKNKDANK